MTTRNYLPDVREQYEELPYPPRDPNDEKNRLLRTWLDDLAMINHYCFSGGGAFRNGFRVLVAGGGTGDSTIFLAEQLRHTNAEIVHLDMSEASIEVARQRARVRALDNIEWVHDSLLALPQLGLGKFDYINCIGVIHHLEDPDAGLRALLAVLKDTGAMGIMVYAQYGRTGVYQMQSLMRLINGDGADTRRKITNTREVLTAAPLTNWFKRGEELFNDHKFWGDAGIYDLLLHSRDRAYTVGELYDWFEGQHGLHIDLTYPGRGRSAYLPHMLAARGQPQFLKSTQALSPRKQLEIGELLSGAVIMHTFFATHRVDAKAPYGNLDYVPMLVNGPNGNQLSVLIRQNNSKSFMVNDSSTGIAGLLDPGRFGAHIAKHIDGEGDFRTIFARVRTEPEFRASPLTDDDLWRDFRPLYDFLTAVDRLLMRHRNAELPAGNGVANAKNRLG